MSTGEKPLLVIFAGPNGSGKSTLTDMYYAEQVSIPKMYINADVIKKETGCTDLEAAQAATRQRLEALAQRQSFTMETVMSREDKLDLMREAKAQGYEVRLFFVTTQDVRLNLHRVENRVKAGGHYVPPEKTTSRYYKAMQLLPQALQISNSAYVFDNSFESPKLIIEKTQDKKLQLYPQDANPISKWTQESLDGIRDQVRAIDERLQCIDRATSSTTTLNKLAPGKELYDTYAKEIITNTGKGWTSKADSVLVENMVKNGFTEQRIGEALQHSPALIGLTGRERARAALGAVKEAVKQPEIQKLIAAKGLER